MGLSVSTTVVVNLLVSPQLLRLHIQRAQLSNKHNVMDHVETAAPYANGISLALSLLVRLIAALLASLYLSHQLTTAVGNIADASQQIVEGDYSMRVEETALSDDVSQLVRFFNDMTQRLEQTESSHMRLFSDLAHEIRTPVAIIRAQSEAVDDDVIDASDAQAVLRIQSERLVALSDDLSLLPRVEEGRLTYDMKSFDLAETAEDAVDS